MTIEEDEKFWNTSSDWRYKQRKRRAQHRAMPGIVGLEKEEPRLPFSLSPFPSDPAPCRPSFSYYRLPVHLLKLTVIKLDGSSFDVRVSRTASVRDLKMAVEELFGQSQQDDPKQDISWTHVWGQFCFSYRGLELVEEKALLKTFGIKDGDQLQFVRHVSISCTPIKQWQRGHATKAERRRKSWSGAEFLDFEFESAKENRRKRGLTPVINAEISESSDKWEATDTGEEEQLVVKNYSQSKLSRYLKGFLCYSNPIYTTRERWDCQFDGTPETY